MELHRPETYTTGYCSPVVTNDLMNHCPPKQPDPVPWWVPPSWPYYCPPPRQCPYCSHCYCCRPGVIYAH